MNMIRTRNLLLSFAAPILAATFLATVDDALAACTLPNQLQNSDLADATKVGANFTTLANCADAQTPSAAANSVIYNSGGGALAGTAPLSDGQLLIGSSGKPAQVGTISAGSGIAVTGGSASLTISATGSGTGAAVDWLNKMAVVKPNAASFTMKTSSTPPAGAALTSTTRGMLLSTSSIADSRSIMAEVPLPSGNWQATMLSVYTGSSSLYTHPSIAVRDANLKRAVSFSIGGGGGTSSYDFFYNLSSGGVGLDNYVNGGGVYDMGFPAPSEPIWSRLTYNGTNLIWSYSRDGENFTAAYTVSATDYLTTLSTVGPAVLFYQPAHPSWNSGFHILSWSLVSL